ncbi:MAG: methylenetetrahydrofolate--tRNA-(uracil(54)-C(5))-methyltransferase (FADH(2)-oxidizing) TrmFO [Polyangiaceae bacterium]
MSRVVVVGAGLAGCEAAFQLAERGHDVELREMKPAKRTPAQSSDDLCELVCSNSLRGAAIFNAVGLLKEELRRLSSVVMRAADATRVPAGGALAVDRDRFAAFVSGVMRDHPRIRVVPGEVTRVPDERPLVLATGPLTSDALAKDIERVVGSSRLAYYDAIAPIVSADSIDMSKVWRQSRYDKGAVDGGDDAYINCPFDEAGYKAFVRALVEAEKVEARSFEEVRYFEGCLPCEVMAERGEATLSFGPMKPVGLIDPRTGKRPFAVIQLRQEDAAGTAYNLVGFQTRMKYGEQTRVFRTIPGLENAEFMRLGSVHRNTFVEGPVALDGELQLRALDGVYLAGQIAGVEGYVESAAGGLLAALSIAQRAAGKPVRMPPASTALGGLVHHMTTAPLHGARYQPSNLTWAQIHAADVRDARGKRLPKRERYEAQAARALEDLETYRAAL